MDFGVDCAAPPPDLPAAVAKLAKLPGTSFLVAPLAHPRYRRDHKRPRDEPMTRSDLVLNSTQWGKHVVGKVSPWLQLDSPHEAIRRRSEEAFREEVAWAAHLGLSFLLLPPPSPGGCTNYARLVQWACLATQHVKFLVRVPIAAAVEDDDDGGGGTPGSTAAAEDRGPWACWDRLRTLCEQSASLCVALEIGIDLPESDAELRRWCGEPVAMLLLPTSTFLLNTKGYPALPRKHQAAVQSLMAYRPRIVLSHTIHTKPAPAMYGTRQWVGTAKKQMPFAGTQNAAQVDASARTLALHVDATSLTRTGRSSLRAVTHSAAK